MQDDKAKFDRAGAFILGVNSASAADHGRYCQKKGFTFPILADPDLAISRAYGAEHSGRIARTVVVVGRDGRIAFHRAGMPTDDEILEAIA